MNFPFSRSACSRHLLASKVAGAVSLWSVLFLPHGFQQMALAKPAHSIAAKATLAGTKGNEISGVVTFDSVEGGVKVTAEVEGLAAGDHGFHIHQFGDCSSPDGKSAGGHFSPQESLHGAPDTETHHVGDMGNIEANEEGKASLSHVFSKMSLRGKNSVVGRAVIIHAKADEFTQPTGDAGSRVACGIIGVSK